MKRFALKLIGSLCVALCSHQASAADWYAGKTITIVVGSDVGGGYDAYARLVARYLAEAIPGRPGVIVQNMPGAGSATAAGYVYKVAPKDGTVIAAISPDALVAPLFDQHPSATYDPTKFVYLGSADNGARLCVTSESSKIRTANDAKHVSAIIGAAGTGSSSSDYALLHRATADLKFNIVTGYKGTADLLLAMERGEIDGFCGVDWSSFKSARPNWVRDGKVHILFSVGGKASADLTGLGVPSAYDFVADPENRAIVELITAQQVFSRPFALSPGVPEDRAEILRVAFDSVMKSANLIADANKSGLALAPTSAGEIQVSILKAYGAPSALIDRAKKILNH